MEKWSNVREDIRGKKFENGSEADHVKAAQITPGISHDPRAKDSCKMMGFGAISAVIFNFDSPTAAVETHFTKVSSNCLFFYLDSNERNVLQYSCLFNRFFFSFFFCIPLS